MKQEQIKLLGEAEFMDEAIQQRKGEIDQIEKIMSDINTIAKDVSMETFKAREKLQTLDSHMTVSADNSKEGLNQLN